MKIIFIFSLVALAAFASSIPALANGGRHGTLAGQVTLTTCISTNCRRIPRVGVVVKVCPVGHGRIAISGKQRVLVCQPHFLSTTTTNNMGKYSLTLSPDYYYITADFVSPVSGNVPAQTRVRAGVTTNFNISLDSGSR